MRINLREELLAAHGRISLRVAVLTASAADTSTGLVVDAFISNVDVIEMSESSAPVMHASPERKRTPVAGVTTATGVIPPLNTIPMPTCRAIAIVCKKMRIYAR